MNGEVNHKGCTIWPRSWSLVRLRSWDVPTVCFFSAHSLNQEFSFLETLCLYLSTRTRTKLTVNCIEIIVNNVERIRIPLFEIKILILLLKDYLLYRVLFHKKISFENAPRFNTTIFSKVTSVL